MPLIDDTTDTTGGNSGTGTDTPEYELPGTAEVTEEAADDNVPSVRLVTEDGSGLCNANSYADLDFALEYCASKGYSNWLSLSEDEQKVYLIRGSEFVDNFYEWKGKRCSMEQGMSFPRRGIYDDDGFPVNGIPVRLKKACIEAAFLSSSSSSNTLFSQKDVNGDIKKKKIDVIEKEYFAKSSEDSSSKTDYTSIYDILNKLLKGLYRTKDEQGSINRRVIWQF